MTEHTDQIRRRFSGPEWERLAALGFPLPEYARSVLDRYHARAKAEQEHVAGYSRTHPLAQRIDGRRYRSIAEYARVTQIPYTTAVRKFNPCRQAKGVA